MTRPPRLEKTDPRLLAFQAGPISDETSAEIRAHQERYAAKRAARPQAEAPEPPAPPERRTGIERRAADQHLADRRQGARRTMQDTLDLAAKKADARRFTGEPISGFGQLHEKA